MLGLLIGPASSPVSGQNFGNIKPRTVLGNPDPAQTRPAVPFDMDISSGSVHTTADLQAAKSTDYPGGVWRTGSQYGSPMHYHASAGACTISGGDGGSQIPTADGKCWVWEPENMMAAVEQFGALPDASADSTAPINKCLVAIGPNGTCWATGKYLVSGGNIQIPGTRTLRCSQTLPDNEDAALAVMNTQPALVLESSATVTPTGASAALMGCFVWMHSVNGTASLTPFPVADSTHYAGRGVWDNGQDSFKVSDTVIVGFDICAQADGARPNWYNIRYDCSGATNPAAFWVNNGNHDAGFFDKIKGNPLGTGNDQTGTKCAAVTRPGNGFRVDGINEIGDLIVQNYRSSQIAVGATYVWTGKGWWADFVGACRPTYLPIGILAYPNANFNVAHIDINAQGFGIVDRSDTFGRFEVGSLFLNGAWETCIQIGDPNQTPPRKGGVWHVGSIYGNALASGGPPGGFTCNQSNTAGNGGLLVYADTSGFGSLTVDANYLTGVPAPHVASSVGPVYIGKQIKIPSTGGAVVIYGANIAAPDSGVANPNLLCNGGLDFDQALEGAAISIVPNSSGHAADCWNVFNTSTIATIQAQRDSANFPPGFGFSEAVRVSSTSGGTGAGDLLRFQQTIESKRLAGLGLGTSGGGVGILTASGWMLCNGGSSLTAPMQYSVYFGNSTLNRYYQVPITIGNKGVWTPFIASIPVDTTGAWDTTSTSGSAVFGITLSAGTTYQGAANTWNASAVLASAGQTQLQFAAGNYCEIVAKLENSAQPSYFRDRTADQELALVQRYYEKSYDIGTALGTVTQVGQLTVTTPVSATYTTNFNVPYMVSKRATPAVTAFSPNSGASGAIAYFNGTTLADVTGVTFNNIGTKRAMTSIGGAPTAGGEYLVHFVVDARF